ncbi:MAG: pyridoxamine 5'-phosphate oxidase family protein [Acidobacteriota bacterium]|nr:MAG: pyridoxamine 5'-phosphate oxidase family protein [Acidobacteriota bacterium]
MIEIEDLTREESIELLESIGYGHLACCKNDRPYVVPVHYAFTDEKAYIYTTEGKKSDIIKANPNVCLQVEDVATNRDWQSVILEGKAERIGPGEERDLVIALISKINPTFTPAVSIRWLDSWVRENVEVIFRIVPENISGRRGVDRTEKPFAPHPQDRVPN